MGAADADVVRVAEAVDSDEAEDVALAVVAAVPLAETVAVSDGCIEPELLDVLEDDIELVADDVGELSALREVTELAESNDVLLDSDDGLPKCVASLDPLTDADSVADGVSVARVLEVGSADDVSDCAPVRVELPLAEELEVDVLDPLEDSVTKAEPVLVSPADFEKVKTLDTDGA